MKISINELSTLLDCWSNDSELKLLPKRLQRACEVEFGSFHHPAAPVIASALLNPSKSRLPETIVDDENGVQGTRKNQNILLDSVVKPLPRHILTINWGGSFFANTWLQKYYLFSVPELNMACVTGSVDSTEMYGYSDFLLGAFGNLAGDLDLKLNCGSVIIEEWRSLLLEFNQGKWTEVEEEGILNDDMAFGMSLGVGW